VAIDTSTPHGAVGPMGEATASPSDPEARARARVGSVLRGKWHLDTLLGIGGMATVYAATHRNGSHAAVKILHPELCVNADVLRRFLHEGQAANTVEHDGCVRVIDDDVAEDGSPFLVTELLKGETLEDRALRMGGRLDEDDVLMVADQLLDVLAAAHAKGVIHRDLKPDNVFVTHSGEVKVLDFGIARLCQESITTRGTKTGSLMGTPAFMPPEQARGLWAEVDAVSDLWACGATLFSVLTGRAVHDGRTQNEVLLSAMTKTAPALSAVAPAISKGLAEVVDRALAFDRAERWPDAQAMQQAVRRAYQALRGIPISAAPGLATKATGAPTTLASTTTASPVARSTEISIAVERPRTGRLAIAIAAGAIALVGAGLLFVFALRGPWHSAQSASAEPVGSASQRLGAASPPPETAPATEPTVVAAPVSNAPPSDTVGTEAASPPPTGTPRAAPRGVASTIKPSSPSGSSSPSVASKVGCTPPYVLDPGTGKKRWKAECL
jgi:serine/threonine protein kinase